MAKKIPRKLRVGVKHYKVERPHVLESLHVYGDINHYTKKIRVARHVRHVALPEALIRISTRQQWEVFWHEVVHAILRDMKRHDLNNERFVNAFCERLYQALDSK